MEKGIAKKSNTSKKITKVIGNFDVMTFACVMILVIFGTIMVFSASYVQAQYKQKDAFFFLKKNVIFTILGTISMIIISKIPYKNYKKWALPIYIITVILLLLVLTPLGTDFNGAKRWLSIKGLTLMPSEVAKFGSIIMLAKVLSNTRHSVEKTFIGVIRPMMMVICLFALILLEPDMSTGGTLLITAAIMLFVAGIRWIYVFIGMGLITTLALVLAKSEAYRWKRVISFLDPFKYFNSGGFQVIQSIYALTGGGIFGLGLGKSRRKFFYIPEPQNDFIFAIIGEELGYIGGIILMLVFMFLIYRCIKIAINAPDFYACMLVTGITSQLIVQILINIAVATSSMPVTGIPLPFISYGGTSLVIFMSAIGIILNVSRYKDGSEIK